MGTVGTVRWVPPPRPLVHAAPWKKHLEEVATEVLLHVVVELALEVFDFHALPVLACRSKASIA